MNAEVAWFHAMVWVAVLCWHAYLWLVKLGIIKPKPIEFKTGGKMDLQKPFELKPLVEALKQKGLTDAEVLAEDILKATFDWLNTSVKMELQGIPFAASTLIPFVENLEKKALEAVDKLDGQPG